MFRFIIRGRNCGRYLDDCIMSLQKQTIQDWCAVVLVDPSEDDTLEKLAGWILKDPRIRVVINNETYGVCHNMWQGLQEIGKAYPPIPAAEDDDIVAILDLDDYLFRPTSLEIVNKCYLEDPEIMATYGSFRYGANIKSDLCKKYNYWEKPRKSKWRASHLKTFKYCIIKHIPQDYFMHAGKWGKGASDLALMFCVMELIGHHRIKRIKKSVYFYRTNIPSSLNRKIQKRYAYLWRMKKPLKQIY